MNFFRALMSSFMVAAFSTILLMALGPGISLGEHRGPANAIPAADMVTAFHYVFGAATALLACAALCILLMEERPLAGPTTPAQLAEKGDTVVFRPFLLCMGLFCEFLCRASRCSAEACLRV